MFRKLAIQFFSGRHLIPLDTSLAHSRCNSTETVTRYSGRLAEPQKPRQDSVICKIFLRKRHLTLSSFHSKYLNRKRRFSRRFLSASNRGSSMINHAAPTGISRPMPKLFRPFIFFSPIGHAGLLFRFHRPRLSRPVLPKPEFSSALFQHISLINHYLAASALPVGNTLILHSRINLTH